MRSSTRSRRAIAPPSAPFEVPCDGGLTGLTRDGEGLIGVLAVAAPPAAPVVAGVAAVPDAALLPAVSAALSARDAAPQSIDVVSHTMSRWPDGPAGHAYRGLLGGLSIAAHRSVHLVVRVRPSDFPDAVRLRGGPGAGSVRTTLWCLRRLQAHLAEAGVRSRPLAAAEIIDLAASLTEGVPVSAADLGPTGLRHNGFPLTVYRWTGTTAQALSALLAMPTAVDSVSTTLTVRLAATADGPRLSATVRDNGGPVRDRAADHGIELITDRPRSAAALGLPVPAPPEPAGRGASITAPQRLTPAQTAAVVAATTVPLAGDGQLVGAADSGAPVTLRMAGPGVPLSHVVGDDLLARQTVVRLAALGVTVAVASDRPRYWEQLGATIGGGLIRVAGTDPTARAVFDETRGGGRQAPPGSTLIRRHSTADADPDDGAPTIRAQQVPGLVEAAGGGIRVPVRVVSTAAERSLVDAVET